MSGAPAASRADRAQLAVALGAVVAGLVVRLASVGVLAVGPDDAEYIGVGRRLWLLHAPHGIDGTLYTIRSWVWPLVIGAASRLGPADPFAGPRVLGVALGLLAVTTAVGLGYRTARGRGALGVAAALLVTSAVWEIVASTRVDVALLAAVMVTLTVAVRPSPRRALLAGALAGLTLLVKETSAPLVLLPLAWLGAVPRTAWRALAVRFVGAFVAVVAWWFVVVLVVRGEIFPLQGVAQADRLAVPRPWAPDGAALLMVAAWVVGAIALVVWRRREVAVRVVLVGFAAMVPAAAVAWHQELALRQFVPLAALGAVVAGVGGSELLARALDRVPAARRSSAALAAGALVVVALAVPLVRVHTVSDPTEIAPLDATIASWLGTVPSGGRVASTFRYQAQVWARLGERVDVERLTFANPGRVTRPARQVWIDWRLGTFHTLSRAELRHETARRRGPRPERPAPARTDRARAVARRAGIDGRRDPPPPRRPHRSRRLGPALRAAPAARRGHPDLAHHDRAGPDDRRGGAPAAGGRDRRAGRRDRTRGGARRPTHRHDAGDARQPALTAPTAAAACTRRRATA